MIYGQVELKVKFPNIKRLKQFLGTVKLPWFFMDCGKFTLSCDYSEQLMKLANQLRGKIIKP